MIRLAAPSKINLSLDILQPRADGFHDLATVFQAIDWCDEITIQTAKADTLVVTGPFAAGVPLDADNLVCKAVELIRRAAPDTVPPLDIRLAKHIPAGGGLGGGSSDAVVVLRALAARWATSLTGADLHRLAAELGSDCAFFLRGGTALATGRGEILRPLARRREYFVLVAVPHAHVPTASAFAALDASDKGPVTDWSALEGWLEAGQPLPELHNSFERSVSLAYPPVAEALGRLRAVNPLGAHLSGSGAACFSIFRSRREAAAALRELECPELTVRLCEPC